jgi:hypothetical protein
MKRTFLVVMMIGLAASAFGQAAYLKVVATENRSSRSGGYYSTNVEREEVYNVTVKNMAPAAYEYTIEWMFLVKPAGGGKVVPFRAEEKKLTLEKNASTTIEVRSPILTSTESSSYYYYYYGNTYAGSKFAGYVVRVKANDKILAVEANDTTLKRKYQDPKVEWGMPKPPTTSRSSTRP